MIQDRLLQLECCPFFFSNPDNVHLLLKTFLKVPTTTKLNNKQFLLFLEEIYAIGAIALDIYIPEPKEIKLLRDEL